jgi:hypothetical protein
VKWSLRILLALFFFFSGPVSIWADCFRHSHEGHHHSSVSALQDRDESNDEDSAAWLHCSPLQFDLDAVSSTLTTSKPKPIEYKYNLARQPDFTADQFSLAIRSRSFETAQNPLTYPYVIGISPHLLLSVIRI